MKNKDKNKLDKIWSLKIKEDAGFFCEISGTPGTMCQLHSHHFYGRRNLSTRWYLPNGWCLSASVHKLNTNSAHEAPEYFRKQALDVRGKKWLTDLNKQFNKTFKGDFETVKKYLDGIVDNYC